MLTIAFFVITVVLYVLPGAPLLLALLEGQTRLPYAGAALYPFVVSGACVGFALIFWLAGALGSRLGGPVLPLLRRAYRRAGLGPTSLMLTSLGIVASFVGLVSGFGGVTSVTFVGLATTAGVLHGLRWEIGRELLERDDYVAPLVEAPPPPSADDGELVDIQIDWSFQRANGEACRMEVEAQVPRFLYEELKARERVPIRNWAEEYVVGGTTLEVKSIAAQIAASAYRDSFGALDQAQAVLSMVHHAVEYALDADSTPNHEHPRYPTETLVESRGDCEDSAFVAGAVLRAMGVPVCLVALPKHIALGVEGADHLPGRFLDDPTSGRKFFYCEVTGQNWRVGEVPDDVDLSKAQILAVL